MWALSYWNMLSRSENACPIPQILNYAMYLFQHRPKIPEAGLTACKFLLTSANPCQLAILCSSSSLISKSRFCAWNHKLTTVYLLCYHIRTNIMSSVTRAMVCFGCYLVHVACLSWKLTVDWQESFSVLLKISCVLSFFSFESEKHCIWLNSKLPHEHHANRYKWKYKNDQLLCALFCRMFT